MKFENKSKEKRINAILFFCKNTKYLSLTKLCKLLYFLDFIHFKEVGRPVTDLEYFAWDLGPVPTKLYFEVKSKKAPKEILQCIREEKDADTGREKGTFFRSSQNPKLDVFSERELRILENVSYIYNEANADDMIEITHLKNQPWDITIKSKGEKAKIDFILALDSEALIDEDLAKERIKLSQEMNQLFGQKD
jgi:uncharacterized phage-associated protein